MQLIHEFLEKSCEKYPHKVALLHAQHTFTYAQINTLSNKIAHLLLSCGFKKADRVLVIMENSFENVASYYGILKAGGACVEVHDRSTLAEATYYIRNSGAKICILSTSSAERFEGLDIPTTISPRAQSADQSKTLLPWTDLDSMPDTAPPAIVHENDLAAIVYTSGSTGSPKRVMLSHRNLCTNTASIV